MPAPNSTTIHYQNDLRRLSATIGVALLLFGVLLVGIVTYAGWSANRNAVARERQLVQNALDQSVSRVLDQQKAIAWWDEPVRALTARRLDISWLEENVGVYFYETYGHDEVIIVDGANRPVYANVAGILTNPMAAYAMHADVLDQIVAEARGAASGGLRQRDAAFEAGQANYSALLGASFGRWAGHIMPVDGAPAVVSAISIVPNIDAGLLRGEPHLLLSVVKIDDAFMSDVGASLLISDLRISPQSTRSASLLSEPFTSDDGSSVGYLSWTPRKPGQTLLLFILPLVAVGVIGASILTLLMLARLKTASGDLADRERQSRHQALHDPLSALPNRRHFVESLQEALDSLAQSRSNSRVIVAYVDVDRFKDVNDTLGHQAGDALIMSVAQELRRTVGPGDFLARFGGDEFAVLRRAQSEADAEELVGRLQSAFQQAFDVHGQHMRMTCSIGLSIAPNHGMSPEDLMRNADIALYRAKDAGRDRAMVFNVEMAADVERRREIELDLLDALKAEQLTLHYQPLIACSNSRISGVEALLRWRHPVKGDISPGVFVPIAEEAGLMPALGAFVLERALRDAQRWPDLEISINLSPVQFRHVDLVSMLHDLLAKHQIDPSRIVLEVTEGVLMESTDRNRQVLEEIRELGFRVALDDFGTGYSSLRYLSDFRFDKIKIDRSFVTGIQERKRSMTIIQSVITLGRGLGMDIVAEGVESAAEASIMRLLGVTELQGFYFSRAVPADAVQDLVAAFEGGAEAAFDEVRLSTKLARRT